MAGPASLDELFAAASADWENIRDEVWVAHGNATPDPSKSDVRGSVYVLRDGGGDELAEYYFGGLARDGSFERTWPNPGEPAIRP